MTITRICTVAAFAVTLHTSSASQAPMAGTPSIPQGLRVPIHESTSQAVALGGAQPADRTELWSAGDTYKASFHDGFAFVPYLGSDYPHTQQFAWRTIAIEVGGQPLVAPTGAAGHTSAEYRYEYDLRNGVVEAYDVGSDGVEQTFRFERPLGDGDLVVVGAVDTALRAEAREFAHGKVVLRDDVGRPVIEYGAAVAYDASGRSTAVDTCVRGDELRLRVPGAWLAGATYPVTIDPLLTRAVHSSWTGSFGNIANVDIGHDPSRSFSVLAFDRATSQTDYDVWAISVQDDTNAASSRVLFTELSSSNSSFDPCVAHVRSADRWVVAYTRQQRVLNTITSGIAYHVHNANDLSTRADIRLVPRPSVADDQDSHPDVGGSFGTISSGKAFLVFRRNHQRSWTDGTNSEVMYTTVDMASGLTGAQDLVPHIAVGTTYDRENPCVNQVSSGRVDGWFVVYQEWNSTITVDEDWDVNGVRFDADGNRQTGTYRVRNNTRIHQLRPVVEGCFEGTGSRPPRYMVGFVTLDAIAYPGKRGGDVGTAIQLERVDWPLGGGYTRTATFAVARSSTPVWQLHDLAFDRSTACHWAGTFVYFPQGRIHVATFGYDAGRIEELIAHTPNQVDLATASICYSAPSGTFPMAYADQDRSVTSPHRLYARVLTHLTEDPPTEFGSGCGNGRLGVLGRVLSGNEFARLQLTQAQPDSVAVFMLAFASADIPLDFLGAPGCTMLLAPDQLLLNLPLQVSSAGSAVIPMPLPTNPLRFAGLLRWQAAYLAPGLNPAGLAATPGLLTRVR
ncbi:MAG: hypothetical protein R3F56_17460 [Planctomycetota bacterium]